MSIFSNRYSEAKHEAGDYTAAVIGLLGNEDPLVVLARTPAALATVIEGLTPEDLSQPEEPGKWSMLHVIRHLADSEVVWAYRVRRIVAEDRPRIEGYDQDRWADGLGYERADLAESLAEIRAIRAGNLRLIRSLSPAQLERVGVHSERGDESIAHLIRMYAGHDLLHLNQLARIRSTLKLGARA